MSKLPTRKFGEVCNFVRGPFGGSLKKSFFVEDGYAVYEQRHAIYNQFENIRYFIDEKKFNELNRFELFSGDLIMSCSGTMGKVAIVPKSIKRGVINQALLKLTPSNSLKVEFLKYWLESPNFQDSISKYSKGAAIKNIASVKVLKQIEIPIPPLAEQQKIVTLLDQAFADIQQAQANIEQNIVNAKELFQSKLNEIFSQRGEGWEEKRLGEVTSKIGSGATPRGGKSSYKESGISLIRSMNIYDEGFKPKNLAFIDKQQADKLKNVTIEKGDVLLNITGASVARCCIVPEEYLPARVNQHVSIIRIKNKILEPTFLQYALISKENKKKLLGIGEQGATRQAITKTQIKNFKISFPSNISVQNKLIEDVNEVKQGTDKLLKIYSQKLDNLEELKKSLLEKAFSGALTRDSMTAS